jgi:hypothetical protein
LVWNTTGTAWFDDLLIGPPYAGPQSAEPADRAVTCARPYDPQSFLSTIIPTPQQLVRLDSQFALVPETRIYVQPEIRRSTADAVNLLNEVVGEHCGSRPGEAVDLPPRGIPPRGVVFCSAGDFPALSGGARISGEAAEALGGSVADAEGYRLLVTSETVLIGAGARAGFLHAVQTLRCLITPVRAGVASIAGVAVRDWPDLSWRGMYLSMWYGPGAGSGCDLDLLRRIVRNVLAGSKMNVLLLQVDNAMRYRSHPELGGLYSADEMREFVGFCSRYGIEVIPLIQSFGHNHYFVFGGGKLHAELAENERMYSVCPRNPGSAALFTDLYDEVIDVFNPRYVHIGCDEVGPLGMCDRCSDVPKWQLFGDYVNVLRDHLAERGVRTMIWGDYLLDPEQFPGSSYCHGKETWRALEVLNKDIVICDWHYKSGVGPKHDYPTTKALHERGFPVVGVPATYSRLNNATYAQYLRRNGLESMFSSVWASVHNWKGIKGHPDWMGGMLEAGEYAWSTNMPPLDRPAPYSAEAIVLGRTRGTTPVGTAGFLVDLRAGVNASLQGDTTGFPFGRHTLGGVRFRILDPMDDEAGRWCIGTGAGDALPEHVADLPIGRSVTALAFLQAWSPGEEKATADWETVGWYDVVYADNETARIPVVSGLNVAPLVQGTARRLYGSGRVVLPENRVAYVLEWRNPYPDRVVHHVNVSRNPAHDGALYVLAVTALKDRALPTVTPVPNEGPMLLEGFGAIENASHERGYVSYRGESVQSWLEYATDGSESVTWRTPALPAVLPQNRVTFAIACGLGSGAGDAAHTISVNGRPAVKIGTPDSTDAAWEGGCGSAFFDYVTHDKWDSFGILYLTVDTALLKAGDPAILSVKGDAADTKSWFMVHRYTDTITYNLLHYGRGLIPPGEPARTPGQE